MSALLRVTLGLWLTLLWPTLAAHEVRPAYLQIREVQTQHYDLLWKTPAQGDQRLALQPVLPARCTAQGEVTGVLLQDAVVERWQLRCEGGLEGQSIEIAKLNATLTDAIVRFEPLHRAPMTLRVTADNPTLTLPAVQSSLEVGLQYLRLGVAHMLSGWDHLLFVLAMCLLVRTPRTLVQVLSMFTLAHSLTLAGTVLGWVRLSAAPVEALIALSILITAWEIARARTGRVGLGSRHPWAMALGFGLLHGFGFAGSLREAGLPGDAIGMALLGFNLGVEVGQLLFVAGVLGLAWIARPGGLHAPFEPALRGGFQAPMWLWRLPLQAIGGLAAFWFLSRSASVLVG